ncbi:uncharacterized protein LOC118181388 [Stegodyphus dumicola]|uniref:uncharacterized protein LOC118181388 n=1 Tax=Stegodyphus dumicola TaxID=202533 RepID=UPI0015AED1F1|nr:uncharacterized protein LOC118181388 [Stegodyphus dumicola]
MDAIALSLNRVNYLVFVFWFIRTVKNWLHGLCTGHDTPQNFKTISFLVLSFIFCTLCCYPIFIYIAYFLTCRYYPWFVTAILIYLERSWLYPRQKRRVVLQVCPSYETSSIPYCKSEPFEISGLLSTTTFNEQEIDGGSEAFEISGLVSTPTNNQQEVDGDSQPFDVSDMPHPLPNEQQGITDCPESERQYAHIKPKPGAKSRRKRRALSYHKPRLNTVKNKGNLVTRSGLVYRSTLPLME